MTPTTGTSAALSPEVAKTQLTPVEEIPAGPQKHTPLSSKPQPVSINTIRRAEFSGPMPPPQLLAHYEQICPGSADRMLRMAEQEAEHRRKTEAVIVQAQIDHHNKQFSEARCGQICALVITIVAIIAGVGTAIHGQEIAGSIIGVGGIGGIVTTFIFGRHRSKPEESKPQEQSKSKAGTSKRKKK
jgi:uncharacterized membrane protein